MPLIYLDIGVHGILGVFNLIIGIALFLEIRHIRLVGLSICLSDILVPIMFIWIWSRIPLIGFLLVIFQILVDISHKGTTILLNEQNAQIALQIAHRAYVMETGRISLEGEASDLIQNEHVRKAYLGL